MCFVVGLALFGITFLFPLNWVQEAFAAAGGCLWIFLGVLKAAE
jgi:hypothetical protein